MYLMRKLILFVCFIVPLYVGYAKEFKSNDVLESVIHQNNGEKAKIKLAKFNLAWIESESKRLTVTKRVIRPEVYFKTHPDHQLPEDMVIQRFKVEFEANIGGADGEYNYMYELLDAQGDAKLLNWDNQNKYSSSKKNTFLADWYGANIIKVTAKNGEGDVVATALDTIFVHFSHSQLAGGDVKNLDKSYGGRSI